MTQTSGAVHPSEDAGVPEVGALWHTTVAGRLHALFGCYCTDPAKVAFVEELQGALASVSPVPAPTPEAVQLLLSLFENAVRSDAILEQYGSYAAVCSAREKVLTALATPQPPRAGEVHPDTVRLDTAQRLLRGCDFAWGDPDAPRSVVVLDIPQGVRVGADFRAFLDAATPEGR